MTREVTRASSQMMETSFSAAHKTSRFECTTHLTLMSGNTTKQSIIHSVNGLLQMPH